MTREQINEMYDTVQCPKCGSVAYCEDMRCTGSGHQQAKPHRERIREYNRVKAIPKLQEAKRKIARLTELNRVLQGGGMEGAKRT